MCVASEERKDEMNWNMKKLLNIFIRNGIEVLLDMVKERVQDEYCAPFLKSVHLSKLRGGFLASGYAPSLQDYVQKRNSIRERWELQKQV